MGSLEIPNWLEGLPLAPEFRPTETEFADPIAYISKIEREASAFGICKVIPPLPKPSKKYVFSNLNKSLSKCPELGSHGNSSSERNSASKIGSSDGGGDDGEARAVFTTRQQELGQSVKKSKGAVQNPPSGVYKQVWQSGEIYTLDQFEAKSKAFAKSQLGMVKEASPLVVEAMFWKAATEKPIYLEYANDVPGSGFGEPEGQFRNFHRRRRKRNFFRRNGESPSCKTNEIASDRIDATQNDYGKDASPKNDLDACLDVPKTPTSPPTLPANEASQSSKKKSHSSCHDKEGTAGWKISNSPWNLQVISRSPGSLTRFMPDDIPGVTSPMVYIGMLFSWFAWHVEDHELHSMNFLHTGSSKTWYSVPGDYAFAFEELVRSEAYGGNIDRIAALALLGEKTTLMSPGVVVASGIPCCRLIQNPGEFVVTFPRAYHVGFSHGFNCGEAANFGTPQWLKVAKEAAVRRAAMNYLPMLSHQQLLYLLTMSFVLRVPRSFLPGVRSSRLRDRQKEERELLVKKAFIEDILQGNSTLSVLLGKDSGYRAVLWNPDLLTYPSKETPSPRAGVTVGTISTEKPSHMDPKEHKNDNNYLFDEMSLYMENLDDLYFGSDDLSCDFQVDSGTLACVACGILGFPFMSVVQPSDKATLELHHDHLFIEERHGLSKCSSSKNLDPPNTGSFKESLLPIASDSASEADLPIKSNAGWNAHNKFLRPRSFCLEHAVEIVELLQCKGGANVLVICHSDYQKIKAHATTIAEEIGSPFNYKEVPLDMASKEDLNLIDLAIDDEERNKYGEDWTSKLGINLRHCVKIRKNSPSKQVQHALTLGGLFSSKCLASDFSAIKWQLRRSRSKKIYYPANIKPSNSAESKNDVVLEESSLTIKKEVKLIQYSRRNFKRKQGGSAGAGKGCGGHAIVKDREQSEIESELNNQNGGNFNSFSFSPSNRMSRMQSEIQIPEHKRDESLEAGLGSVETQIETRTSEEMNVDSEAHNLASLDGSMMQDEPNVETKTASYTDEGNGKSFEVHKEKQVGGQFNRTNKACSLASDVHSYVEADEVVLASSLANSSDEGFEGRTSIAAVENDCTNGQVCDLVAVDDEVVSGVHATENNNGKPLSCNSATGGNNERPVSCSSTIKDVASTEEFFEGPRETCSAECSSNDKPLAVNPDQIKTENSSNGDTLEIKPQEAKSRIKEYPPASIEETSEVSKKTPSTKDLSNSISLAAEAEQELNNIIKESVPVSTEEASESPSDLCAASKKCNGLTLDKEVHQKVGTLAGRTEELASSSVTHMECSTVPWGESPQEDLGNDMISEQETLMESGEQGSVSIVVGQTGKQPVHEGESELPDSAPDHLVDGLTSNNNTERKCQEDEEAGLQTANTFQKYSRAKRDSRATENLSSGTEVCSLPGDRELNNAESNVINAGSNAKKGGKRKREIELLTENKFLCSGYIRSPCEGLRPRAGKDATATSSGTNIDVEVKEKPRAKIKKPSTTRAPPKDNKQENSGKSHKCDIEGCRMSFDTKLELSLHKRNRCPHEGCGKRFSSHKYAMIHHRVHDDERPLKCPWKGCSMSFKWAWARTEHIRVHTGERPYKCKIEGCGLSFRFVSDFSRHRRKTGHYVN